MGLIVPTSRVGAVNALWERRIAIMATFHYIRQNEFNTALDISEKMLASLKAKATRASLEHPPCIVADMRDLIFKGTVDEIDVGKLHEGMPARIKVGALPEAKVEGRVRKIAPKSRSEEGATLFDIDIGNVRDATPEELAHGHAHGIDGHSGH